MKRILPIWIQLIVLIINVSNVFLQDLACAATSARTFYVALNGNDQWSGALSVPTASGTDGPFATLKRARNAIRVLRSKGSNDAFTVLVRGGIYQLEETLVLDTEDSGTASQPLIFRAFPSEQPVLSGARIITDLEPCKGHILKADLTGIIKDSRSVRQLFANGKRQMLARFPNFDPHDPVGGGFCYVENTVEGDSKRRFKYKKGDVREWTGLNDAEVFIFPGSNWGGRILSIQAIDKVSRVITLSGEAAHEIKAGNRYYFQNIMEELDSPGEWHFDRKKKILHYWPVDGKDNAEISIPVIKNILEIRGKKLGDKYYGKPSHIRFEGFTFEGCEGSAVIIKGAEKIVIAKSTIYNAGGNGIEIHDGSGNAAIGNDIYGVGGTGIAISAGDRKTLTPANNRAENNYIHDIGVFEKGFASGILCRGVGNIVSHNLIHSMPRVGVWINGNDNLVEYNHIHHVNQETQDSGIIYFANVDWTKRGNVIRFNYLHDSGGYGRNRLTGTWQTPFDTYGIYMDDWTSGTEVYGNIVASTANGGTFIHSGRDNMVENNIIIDGGRLGQMVYSAWPPSHPVAKKWHPLMFAKIAEMGYKKYPLISDIKDIETGARMSGNHFLRNILYYSGRDAILYGIYNDIDLSTTVSDYNTIYHGGLPLLVPFTKAPAERQWTAWQEKGFDRHSLTADPLFSDVAKGDFTLSPFSPALKLGFKPIPFEKIGPYKDPLRASWPVPVQNIQATPVPIL